MEKKMSKKKITFLCVLGVVILALLVLSIGYIAGWFDKGVDADVVTVGQRKIVATFDTSGTVSSSEEGAFNIVDGVKVKKVNVKVGSVVKEGDVLAEFDAASLNCVLKEKKAALDSAQKAYNDYKKESAAAKNQIAAINNQVVQAEKRVAELEKKAQNEKTQSKLDKEEEKQAQQAQDNLSSIIKDSSLAGKIIDNIVNSSESLQSIKNILDSISSMNGSSLGDMTSIMSSMTSGSAEYELMQAQMELATLKMTQLTTESKANGTLETVYKSVYESSLNGYNETKATIDSLNFGWIAAKDGVVSEVNIVEGETVSVQKQTSVDSFDTSAIISAVTSGGDISSLVGSIFATDTVGIKVQYYPLEISFMINKADLKNVTVGKKVSVESESGKELEGEVTFVAAVASTSSSAIDLNSLLGSAGGSTGGIETVVTVNEPDAGLVIGLDADISIETEEKSNCVTVPVESITYDDKNAYVFVYDPQEKIIKQTVVKTGILDGTYYEILSGVKQGDIIVKTPVSTMLDGDKIVAHNVDEK